MDLNFSSWLVPQPQLFVSVNLVGLVNLVVSIDFAARPTDRLIVSMHCCLQKRYVVPLGFVILVDVPLCRSTQLAGAHSIMRIQLCDCAVLFGLLSLLSGRLNWLAPTL